MHSRHTVRLFWYFVKLPLDGPFLNFFRDLFYKWGYIIVIHLVLNIFSTNWSNNYAVGNKTKTRNNKQMCSCVCLVFLFPILYTWSRITCFISMSALKTGFQFYCTTVKIWCQLQSSRMLELQSRLDESTLEVFTVQNVCVAFLLLLILKQSPVSR